VELNPVRARIVGHPKDYRWSSYRTRIGMIETHWLDEHDCYTSLGETQDCRRKRYEAFICDTPPDNKCKLIRQSLQRGQLTGDSRFIDEVEKMIGRRIEHRAPGNQPLTHRFK
jgi:putative transposase